MVGSRTKSWVVIAGSSHQPNLRYLLQFPPLDGRGERAGLLIDTIDVSLNRGGSDVYVKSLLTELAMAGVAVVTASRPGEARMLNAHNPHTVLLFDYSDDEFTRAVA